MKINRLLAVFTVGSVAAITAPAGADERQMIDIPPQSQALLLTEMRALLDNIDDLLSALGDGDFTEVGRIADFKMSFGHARWQKMLDDGVPEAEIQAQRKMMMGRRGGHGGQGKGHGKGQGQGMGQGQGRGQGGASSIFGQGVGRLMPQDVRDLGQQMHAAAEEVSIAAKNAGASPGVEDYKAVAAGIQEITSVCRACHASFRIR